MHTDQASQCLPVSLPRSICPTFPCTPPMLTIKWAPSTLSVMSVRCFLLRNGGRVPHHLLNSHSSCKLAVASTLYYCCPSPPPLGLAFHAVVAALPIAATHHQAELDKHDMPSSWPQRHAQVAPRSAILHREWHCATLGPSVHSTVKHHRTMLDP